MSLSQEECREQHQHELVCYSDSVIKWYCHKCRHNIDMTNKEKVAYAVGHMNGYKVCQKEVRRVLGIME